MVGGSFHDKGGIGVVVILVVGFSTVSGVRIFRDRTPSSPPTYRTQVRGSRP